MSRRFNISRPTRIERVATSQSSILQFFGGENAAAPPPVPEPPKTSTQLRDNDVRKATSGPQEKRMKEDENLAAVDISGIGHLSARVRPKLNCTTLPDDSFPSPKIGRTDTSSPLPSTAMDETISSSPPEDFVAPKMAECARKEGGAEACAAATLRPTKTRGVGVAEVLSGALSPGTDGEESPGMPSFEGLELRRHILASTTTAGCRGSRLARVEGIVDSTGEVCAESGGVPGKDTTQRVPLTPRKCKKLRLTPDVGKTFERGGEVESPPETLSVKRFAAEAQESKEGVAVPGGRGGEYGDGAMSGEETDCEGLDQDIKSFDDSPSGRDNESRLSEVTPVEGTFEVEGHWSRGVKARAKVTTGVGIGHADALDAINKKDDEPNEGISEYELQRLERIKKNQAFMATLGLAAAKPLAPSSAISSSGRNASRRKKKSVPAVRAATVPVRRSVRTRKTNLADGFQVNQKISVAASAPSPQVQPQHVLEEEIDYDDSTVLKYLCMETESEQSGRQGQASAELTPVSRAVSEGARAISVRTLGPDRPLSASSLSTIYSMHFRDGGSECGESPSRALLAAGGKGGVVALFSARQPRAGTTFSQTEPRADKDDERTLMTFKAHNGWVSSVRFVRGGGGRGESIGSCRLLSSANDSVVKLWDASKAGRGLPRLLSTVNDLHPTSKGIFSMDSYGTRVATGSKDATVAIASLRPTGLAPDRVLGDPGGNEMFHTRVIKGVSLRDETTVASCGDDSSVCVSDVRVSTPSGVSCRLSSVHAGSCHTVRWHPRDDNLFITAGLDSTMKLFDLRRLEDPLHVFRGHCPYTLARPRAIHRPEFMSSGKGSFNIITCGERSDKLSMYDASSGATVSRGLLGNEATALAVLRGPSGVDTIAAAVPGGAVLLLTPVWASD